MSKPSATGRPRSFTPGYHRRNLGGGNTLKAGTQARRAAASRQLGHPTGALRAERKAVSKLLATAEQYDRIEELEYAE